MALVMPCAVGAQDFVPFELVILDDAGVGFNETTMRISDIDKGEMREVRLDRIACFEAAVMVWAAHLDINTTIRIDASFESFCDLDPPDPLLCGDATGAALALTTLKTVYHDFFNAPVADTWFTVAEANQIAGLDLDPDPQRVVPSTVFDDIHVVFNSDIDGTALGAVTWYYGTDGIVPADKIDFFSTVLHEVGHGLGFVSLMDVGTGSLYVELDDIFTSQLRQEGSVNLDYTDMTDEERAAANVAARKDADLSNGDKVVWKGTAVVASEGLPERIDVPVPPDDPQQILADLDAIVNISHWAPTVDQTRSFSAKNDPDDLDLLMEPFKTLSFTNLTLERAAFEDMFWPLVPFDRDNVYVDFSFTGFGFGILATAFTPAAPFTTAAKADAAANPGANIFFAPESTSEIGIFSKPATWQSTGGTVTIGVPPVP